jgi:hypothetical protein
VTGRDWADRMPMLLAVTALVLGIIGVVLSVVLLALRAG